MARRTKIGSILWLLLLAGAALRLIGIHYGLPAIFNADEPHVVDIAVSFGAGTLNPHFFKYPTLYMYVLFAAYGVFFILWSGAGFLHSTRQFAELFVWQRAPFYLIARVLSAAFSLAAVYPAFKAGSLILPKPDDELGDRAGLWAAAFLVASPIVIESAHAAKPESLMLFLSSAAWYFAVRHRIHGRAGDLLKCGFLAGLACATQYTAIPATIMIPVAWLAWPSSGIGVLAGALIAAIIGFLAGCPFALLDHSSFLSSLGDLQAMKGMVGGWNAGFAWRVAWNMLTFAGPVWLGGATLILGAAYFLLKDRKSASLLLVPPLFLAACLSASSEGAWQRYLYAGFPALALMAGVGVEWLVRVSECQLRRKIWDRVVSLAGLVIVLALPGAIISWDFDRELSLPDTRTLAAQWIEAHVPPGSKILMDQEHASPPLRLSRDAAERLYARTKALGHPRDRYYEIMKDSHPGGGYAIYQIFRSAEDLRTLPRHAAESAAGRLVLDVREGPDAARKAGVQWVVLSSFGATVEHSPELARFLQQVDKEGKMQMELVPEPNRSRGPRIRIYQIAENKKS